MSSHGILLSNKKKQTTWIDLKKITYSMLSGEKRQCQKIDYYIIPFIHYSQNDKIIEMEDRLVVLGVWVRGEKEHKWAREIFVEIKQSKS